MKESKMLRNYTKIWIDVTDLVGWKGHFTGIQRVEFNLAIRFSQLDNVGFFMVDGADIRAVNFELLRQEIAIELDRSKDDEADDFEQNRPQRSAFRRRLKRTAEQVVRATPMVSFDATVQTYDRIAHAAKGGAGRVKRRMPIRRSPTGRAEDNDYVNDLIEFDRGELVLVLGGNWHIHRYMQNLGRAIRRVDSITFGHVMYDFIPTVQPAFFPAELVKDFRTYIDLVLEDAHIGFAISENTKLDAIRYANQVGIAPPPIHTFRLGDHLDSSTPRMPRKLRANSKQKERASRYDRFIFCPGTVEVRKNHQSLYHTYRLAAERGIKLPHLIIGGKQGWLAGDVFYQIENDPVVRDSITILTTCRDQEFAWLYENSMFVVYPSLYEGWGLPVAEALQHGKLCVASSASSIPEIGGDLVEYFSPDDTGEILEKLHRFSSDDALLAKREELIETTYEPASWDTAYEQVVAAIKTV